MVVSAPSPSASQSEAAGDDESSVHPENKQQVKLSISKLPLKGVLPEKSSGHPIKLAAAVVVPRNV